jgi:hypothetical protein
MAKSTFVISNYSSTINARNGMHIELSQATKEDKGNGYTEYSFTYVETNNTSLRLTQESFTLFLSDGTKESQYGLFYKMNSGETSTRTFTMTILSSATPTILEYDGDNFFATTPTLGTTKWTISDTSLVSISLTDVVSVITCEVVVVDLAPDPTPNDTGIDRIHTDTVQKVFIAYYGRAADPVGLAYWEAQLESSGGNLASIMNSFGNSLEATTLFGSLNSTAKINMLYQQMFGRDADFAGSMYYSQKLTAGTMTAASIAQNVLDGASGTDSTIITNKLAVAKAFTTAIDTATEIASYAGDVAAAAVRTMLSTVNETTLSAYFDVATTIDGLVSGNNLLTAVWSEGVTPATNESEGVIFDSSNLAYLPLETPKVILVGVAYDEGSVGEGFML